jgi:hypothetical protein
MNDETRYEFTIFPRSGGLPVTIEGDSAETERYPGWLVIHDGATEHKFWCEALLGYVSKVLVVESA